MNQADLKQNITEVRQAKSDLIAGKRVGEVTYQGRKVSYVDVSLPQLQAEETRLLSILRKISKPRYSVFQTGKGL